MVPHLRSLLTAVLAAFLAVGLSAGAASATVSPASTLSTLSEDLRVVDPDPQSAAGDAEVAATMDALPIAAPDTGQPAAEVALTETPSQTLALAAFPIALLILAAATLLPLVAQRRR